MHPDLSYENDIWQKGMNVAGMDEAGRGPFAGPVVAGIVAFAPMSLHEESSSRKIVIRDSKKMTEKQRMRAFGWVKENSLFWGVGEASVAEINKNGIKKASLSAFLRAFKKAAKTSTASVDCLLIDGLFIPVAGELSREEKISDNAESRKTTNIKQIAIKKGDAKSISIAAASIVAKVHRDNLMCKLSQNGSYSKYLWHKNKGYGTKEHREAILSYGVTKHHRLQFVETYLKKQNSFE